MAASSGFIRLIFRSVAKPALHRQKSTTMIRRAASQLVTSAAAAHRQKQPQLAHNVSLLLPGINITKRSLTAKAPGTDPLELLRSESEARNLCNSDGYRSSGVHWAMALAAAGETTCHAPNLRTINIARINTDGILFTTKLSQTSCPYANLNPVSFLYTVGKYKPGETIEQWRAEGACAPMDLGIIIDKVPNYAVAETVASIRLAKEKAAAAASAGGNGGSAEAVSKDRTSMGSQAHFMEVVQRTKVELESGGISDEELASCLGAWRLEPSRMERMQGGPDQIMWDRWEWIRQGKVWAKANHILPY